MEETKYLALSSDLLAGMRLGVPGFIWRFLLEGEGWRGVGAGVEWGLVWSGGWCGVGVGVEWGLVWSGGWRGVGGVIRESIDLTEYPRE